MFRIANVRSLRPSRKTSSSGAPLSIQEVKHPFYWTSSLSSAVCPITRFHPGKRTCKQVARVSGFSTVHKVTARVTDTLGKLEGLYLDGPPRAGHSTGSVMERSTAWPSWDPAPGYNALEIKGTRARWEQRKTTKDDSRA